MLGDFFQWDRFVTPRLVRILFWLYIAGIALAVIAGIFSSAMMLGRSLMGGLGGIIGSLLLGAIGVIFVRVISELTIVAFRIEEHLRAVRIRWEA